MQTFQLEDLIGKMKELIMIFLSIIKIQRYQKDKQILDMMNVKHAEILRTEDQ